MPRNLNSLKSRGFVVNRSFLNPNDKPILYIDMDGTAVDFESGIAALSDEDLILYEGRYDEAPNIFAKMEFKEGFVEAFKELSSLYDIYFASTAPWENETAWSDKLLMIRDRLDVGDEATKRLILTHNKQLLVGDILVDDRDQNGAEAFCGGVLKFGSEGAENWSAVLAMLKTAHANLTRYWGTKCEQ